MSHVDSQRRREYHRRYNEKRRASQRRQQEWVDEVVVARMLDFATKQQPLPVGHRLRPSAVEQRRRRALMLERTGRPLTVAEQRLVALLLITWHGYTAWRVAEEFGWNWQKVRHWQVQVITGQRPLFPRGVTCWKVAA